MVNLPKVECCQIWAGYDHGGTSVQVMSPRY